MAANVDMEEIKRAVALRLVALLTGLDSRRLLSLLDADERGRAEHCRGNILTCMAQPASGLVHDDYWVFTFDMAFDRNPQFTHPVFEQLNSQQDRKIAEAARFLFRFREQLSQHELEKGAKENLVDDESRHHREFLEGRVEMFVAGLNYECRVGQIVEDFLWALRQIESEGDSYRKDTLWALRRNASEDEE